MHRANQEQQSSRLRTANAAGNCRRPSTITDGQRQSKRSVHANGFLYRIGEILEYGDFEL